jgi:hypothetical protein
MSNRYYEDFLRYERNQLNPFNVYGGGGLGLSGLAFKPAPRASQPVVSAVAKKTQPPVVVQPKPEIISVSLTLDVETAKTLKVILGRVGGSPTDSRRRHADAISDALEGAGITYRSTAAEREQQNGSGISFVDVPKC